MSVEFKISASSRYIISTSGRYSSLKRYQRLLQKLLGIDVVYIPIHTGDSVETAISPVAFTSVLNGLPCLGGAISKDIKHSVIPYLDAVDESAKELQSVNTVIVHPQTKQLSGYNTDVIGFTAAIRKGILKSGLTIKSAVCYGYGGVAFVVIHVLRSLGITCYLAGRNLDQASERAKELNCEVWSADLPACHLFINATPASEHPLNEAPNMLEALASSQMVFDHEMPGQYLQEYCQEQSIFYIPGTAMYYPQMVAQWRLFLQGVVSEAVLDSLPELLKQAEEEQTALST